MTRTVSYVLDHLDTLVVKAANESGGYGMLDGPPGDPQRAQPRVRASASAPTLATTSPNRRSPSPASRPGCDDHFEGRHVDLRPYILFGRDVYVLPGGLTRVALRKGSLVVNSSQGGGSKDTWVVA